MFAVSSAEAAVLVAWAVGIGCAVARVRAVGPRLTSLVVLALAVVAPVVGSVVAVAMSLRGARSRQVPSP